MSKEFKVNTKFSLVNYIVLVEDIAMFYFDSKSGEYQPHLGNLNAMRLFYNECVTDSEYEADIPHTIEQATDMQVLVEDENFITAFNNALKIENAIDYTFANAYAEAMDIVNYKKTSFAGGIELIKGIVLSLLEKFNDVLTPENIAALTEIANKAQNGEISAEAIVNAYADRLGKGE